VSEVGGGALLWSSEHQARVAAFNIRALAIGALKYQQRMKDLDRQRRRERKKMAKTQEGEGALKRGLSRGRSMKGQSMQMSFRELNTSEDSEEMERGVVLERWGWREAVRRGHAVFALSLGPTEGVACVAKRAFVTDKTAPQAAGESKWEEEEEGCLKGVEWEVGVPSVVLGLWSGELGGRRVKGLLDWPQLRPTCG
jgi:hypothetical protein